MSKIVTLRIFSHLLFSAFIDPLRDEAKEIFLRLMSLPIRGLKVYISKTSYVSYKRRRIIVGLPHSFPGFLLSLVSVQILQRRDSLQSRQKEGSFRSAGLWVTGVRIQMSWCTETTAHPTARMRSRDGPTS